jgi:hypothetical protein
MNTSNVNPTLQKARVLASARPAGDAQGRASSAAFKVETGGSSFFVQTEARFALWDMQVREREVPGAVATARLLARDFPENRSHARRGWRGIGRAFWPRVAECTIEQTPNSVRRMLGGP